MTTTMSDLRKDIVAKILCRVPMTSLRSLRSTCKKWNALSKDQIVGKAATKKQYLGFMMMDSRVCSLRFNLHGIRNEGDSAVDLSIKQVGILDQVEISKVFHCEGLLLCVLKDNSRLLVWNPYMGQTSWIQPRDKFYRLDRYALGYDKKKGIHKILRFIDMYFYVEDKVVLEYEIYDFCSDSWRVLDVTPDWDIEFYHRSVSLKGDSYFFAQEKCMLEGDVVDTTETPDFLLCFDFTAERFGPRLPLPFHSYYEEIVTLSSVRDEQLAVLYQRNWPNEIMEIWVTTNIQPNAVSWTKFLKVDMRPLTGFKFMVAAGSFFIDEEEKVAVVFDLDGHKQPDKPPYQTAHIIGQDGYFKSVNIGGAPNLGKPNMFGHIYPDYCVPLVCSSAYVPSLVQLQINQLGQRKETDWLTLFLASPFTFIRSFLVFRF